MKTELASLELHYLVKELQKLVGARVDQIYQPDGFLFQVHKAGLGKVMLRIEHQVLWLTKAKPEVPERISGLCGLLRKCLEGKKITSLTQIEGERIVRIDFATLAEKFSLYIEMFSNGNLVLTDGDGIIKGAKEERAWKDRAIKKGLPYQRPPARANVFELGEPNFISEEPIGKHLAQLGLGKLYATELCARAHVEADKRSVTTYERNYLLAAYRTLLADSSGAHVYSDGEMAPMKLVHKGEEGKPYDSFSEALDAHLATAATSQKLDRKRKTYLEKRAKVENAIALQEKGLKRAEDDSKTLQRQGELIYEHYQELKEILEELNKARAKYSLQEMKAKLKGHPTIKDVNPKTGEVVVEING